MRSTIVVDDATVAGAALLGEGDDHQGDDGVEGEVGDGHPVLQARPVAHDEDVEVLDARTDTDVLALAVILVDKLRVFHHVGNSHNDCDDEFDKANDVNSSLKGQTTHGSEAGLTAHL